MISNKLTRTGNYLEGVSTLLSAIAETLNVIPERQIRQIINCIPPFRTTKLGRKQAAVQQKDDQVNHTSRLEKLLDQNMNWKNPVEFEMDNLLGRPEVKLDLVPLEQQLMGNKILITGAGGSIGSEISRQLLQFAPTELILLDHAENLIYQIHRELEQIKGNTRITPLIADIRDQDRICQIMKAHQPKIVYHAAAYKHVPLMEQHPREAVKNNIGGTMNVAEAAIESQTEVFVMVSTDKAVHPANVMGASKRIGEMLVTSLNEMNSTNFIVVRFGNVLGSSGSVIPLFKEQIQKGGPITVTDFRMTRYFMTIPEASRLVLQAGGLARGGEVLVLDMGEPVKIVELAKKMIQLSGHTEQDIQIIETGIRPGEKLAEAPLVTNESAYSTAYEKIFISQENKIELKKVKEFINHLNTIPDLELKQELITFANNYSTKTFNFNMDIK